MEADEGIDISHHNGNISWEQFNPSGSGKIFVIAKATEGKTYQDPKFLQNWSAMSAAGFQTGAYHFLRFGTSTPKDQMDNFLTQLRKAGGWTNNSIIALDIEKEENSELVCSVTEECVQYLIDEANLIPYIYTRQNYWNQRVPKTPEIIKQCPLWIARWREKEPSPEELPNGWKEWKIWQYSDKGVVPGISGYVDLNRMKSK